MEQTLELIADLEEQLANETDAAKKRALVKQIAIERAKLTPLDNLQGNDAADTAARKMPKTETFIGRFLGKETVETAKGDVVLLTFQSASGETKKIASSLAYLDKAGARLTTNKVFQLGTEVRKANITGYERDGVWQLHTSNGENLTSITDYSDEAFAEQKELIKSEAILNQRKALAMEFAAKLEKSEKSADLAQMFGMMFASK